MTAASTNTIVDGFPSVTVSGELIDALIEAVVLPPDPRARSAVIGNLVQEICSAVGWRQEDDGRVDGVEDEELVSMRRLVHAAHDHYRWMTAIAATVVAEDLGRAG